MKKIFTPRVRAILILAVILAIAITLSTAVFSGSTTWMRNLVNGVCMPFRSAVSALTGGAEKLYGYLYEYDALKAENDALKSQIAEMESTARVNEENARELERLRELLNFSVVNTEYTFVSAYITTNSGSYWSDTLTIDKGSASGLCEGMCAVTEYGQLVGLLTEVGTNWSTVTTIRDAGSKISAAVSSSGDTGVVQGTWQQNGEYALRMNYLSTSAIPKNGEQVLTTGSALYPKGLTVGYIDGAQLDETGVSKYANLIPGCDFDALEQIFIITSF